MSSIQVGRKTVPNSRDIVVFLIGARINKWWLLPLALPILIKMGAMQRELLRDPESGLLGIQNLGRASLMYFRSTEELFRYAGDKTKEHQPASKRYFQKIFRNEAIGIWHETYFVPAGNYECIYTNMPLFGLGKTAPLVDATHDLATAEARMNFHSKRAASQV
jgi:hypothetical protein